MAVADIIFKLLASVRGGPLESLVLTYFTNMSIARVYLGSDMTAGDNGPVDEEPTKVLLATENFDIGSNFSSYKFTAPVAGYYQFNWSASITNAGSVIYNAFASIYVNGAERSRGTRPYNSGAAFALIKSGGSDLIYMTAGQYAELYVYANTSDSSACTVSAGSPLTFMSVHLVST